MKNTTVIYLSLILFHMAILSCEKEHEPKPDVISTPDVTSLGIAPVAKYTIFDDTYNMRYSKDNRMIQLSGENMSLSHNPIEFMLNGHKCITNFVLNKSGCATYFEVVHSDGSLYCKYHMKYDSDNYMTEIVKETPWNNSSMKWVISRGANGRIENINEYENGELWRKATYTYGKSNIMVNHDGIFVICPVNDINRSFSLYLTGLMGRPSGVLPQKYTAIEYLKNGPSHISGEYTYTINGNHVYAVSEYAYFDDLDNTYIMFTSTYVYKGLYLYD